MRYFTQSLLAIAAFSMIAVPAKASDFERFQEICAVTLISTGSLPPLCRPDSERFGLGWNGQDPISRYCMKARQIAVLGDTEGGILESHVCSGFLNEQTRYPNGNQVLIGGQVYYPNGVLALAANGDAYFSNGSAALTSQMAYYPSGQVFAHGVNSYYPNGTPFRLRNTVYYQNGAILSANGVDYYANGAVVNSGANLFYSDSRYARHNNTLYCRGAQGIPRSPATGEDHYDACLLARLCGVESNDLCFATSSTNNLSLVSAVAAVILLERLSSSL